MVDTRTKITGIFDKLVAKVPEFIQTGSIRRSTRAGGGPSDPNGSTVTNEDTSARMLVFEIEERRIDGTNIFAGDFAVIVEPLGIEVTLADKVICDRGELTIAKLGREASGGETMVYEMVCRG
jgi:hypothetical protein